jgi:glycosyltransferase involved in cell wall biosynthesis
VLSYNPKVSVMIVSYNQEDLIGETIESIVSQDYDNLEVIVADDASTDNTRGVILEYQARFPLIIKPVFNPVNLGVTGNSNAAFQACTGELVAIMGGDDLFLPGKIKAQVALFEDPEVSMSYHPVDIFVHQTGEVLFTTNTTEKERINDVYDLIAKCGIPGASSLMVRRSSCPDYGFDPTFPVVSDWLFSIEVGLRGKVKELAGVYGKYRKHGLGASERTFELLDESLRTLDVISQRFPGDEKITEACRKGRQRYLLGELFRQVVKQNTSKIKHLERYFLADVRGLKYAATKVVFLLLGQKFLLQLFSMPLNGIKSFLKRKV